MPFKKKETAATVAQTVDKAVSSTTVPQNTNVVPGSGAVDSGAKAAIARLKTTATPKTTEALKSSTYKPTEYNDVNNAKSMRILRQGVFQHALVSPALAGMKWSTTDEFLALVKEVADKTIIEIINE